MRRRIGLSLLLAAAVLTGVIATVAVGGGTAPPAPAPRVRLTIATVVRTSLATTVLTAGTLGYAAGPPVINQLQGTYTSLPAAGRTIRAGQALYRVDNQPVTLMRGRTPAWRPLGLGVTPGPDVTELQANLISLGYASGLLSAPTGQFDDATAVAVQRWQAAIGVTVTGQVGLGQVVFLPAAIRAGARDVAPGQVASPGERPYQVTTRRRVVSVPVNPTLPQVAVGERVQIVLPSQDRTPGTVSAIGSGQASSAHGPGSSGASSVLIVTPERPRATGTGAGVAVQVSLTVLSVRHVLAAPVSALVALAGGGYGLEIVTASGAHRLVAVTAGLFAGGRVQVSGAQVTAGTKVVTAQ